MFAPLSVTVLLPAVAATEPLTQLVLAFGGLATVIPAGSVSVNDTLCSVTGGVAVGLSVESTRMSRRTGCPTAALVGVKLFITPSPCSVDSVAVVGRLLVSPCVVVTAPAGIVFTRFRNCTDVTFTNTEQVDAAGSVAPISLTIAVPGTAVTVPLVQVVLMLGTAWTSIPVGRLSVNERLFTADGEPTGLVRSMRSCEGWLPDTLTGLKLLLMPIDRPDTLPSVADTAAVFDAPSFDVMFPIGMLLGQLAGFPLVTTLNSRSQLVPAAIFAPVIVTVLLPGAAVITGEPAQVVLAAAGLATARLDIGPSVIDTPVSGVTEGLVTRTVTCETPPLATEAGVNDLVAVSPDVAVRMALAGEGFCAFWSLLSAPAGMVLVCGPNVAATTLTLKLQLPLAGMVAPAMETVLPEATAVTRPPAQLVEVPGVALTMTPAGSVSLNDELVSGVTV